MKLDESVKGVSTDGKAPGTPRLGSEKHEKKKIVKETESLQKVRNFHDQLCKMKVRWRLILELLNLECAVICALVKIGVVQ